MENTDYILIAEDDEDDQFLLKMAFDEVCKNTKLVFVDNGIELINYFDKIDNGVVSSLPSLLIVDLNMPKKNGREAIRELSEKKCYESFPTVIFSTTGNELERSRCEDLGINKFFVKPSNFDSLLTQVNQFREIAFSFSNGLNPTSY